jgi:Subtilase family
MFQDGIIAQAVDQVVAQGIPFFSAAGNEARQSWIAPTGFDPVIISNNVYHRFGTDSNGSPITIMRISMLGSSALRTIVFQWDDAFASVSGPPGSRSDLDFVMRIGNYLLIRTANNIGVDPIEIFQIVPSDYSINETVTAELNILSYSGPLPTYMKIVVFGQVDSFGFDTESSTSYGHPNAAQGAGVGAARYFSTPAFGVAPPIIDYYFSSAGGTPILFTKTGSRLSSPEIRNQPRFTGPVGVATTFFGFFTSGNYRFFGTSAAAPHVAAVAALMLQYKGGNRSLTPAQIYSTLANTAIDMDDPSTLGFDVGFDFGTGSGLVNASAAFNALAPLPPVPAPNAPVPVPRPTVPIPVPAPTVPIPVPAPTFPLVPAPNAPVTVPGPTAPIPVPAPTAPISLPAPTAPISVPAPTGSIPVPAPTVPISVPAPTAPVRAPIPTAPVLAPTAQVPIPIPPVLAPTAPASAPSAPVLAPKEPVTAPTAPVPAPTAPGPAPNAPVPVPAPKAPVAVPAPKVPVPVPAPEVPAPKLCGLFGLGIFCFPSFCGFFGRLLCLCRE